MQSNNSALAWGWTMYVGVEAIFMFVVVSVLWEIESVVNSTDDATVNGYVRTFASLALVCTICNLLFGLFITVKGLWYDKMPTLVYVAFLIVGATGTVFMPCVAVGIDFMENVFVLSNDIRLHDKEMERRLFGVKLIMWVPVLGLKLIALAGVHGWFIFNNKSKTSTSKKHSDTPTSETHIKNVVIIVLFFLFAVEIVACIFNIVLSAQTLHDIRSFQENSTLGLVESDKKHALTVEVSAVLTICICASSIVVSSLFAIFMSCKHFRTNKIGYTCVVTLATVVYLASVVPVVLVNVMKIVSVPLEERGYQLTSKLDLTVVGVSILLATKCAQMLAGHWLSVDKNKSSASMGYTQAQN